MLARGAVPRPAARHSLRRQGPARGRRRAAPPGAPSPTATRSSTTTPPSSAGWTTPAPCWWPSSRLGALAWGDVWFGGTTLQSVESRRRVRAARRPAPRRAVVGRPGAVRHRHRDLGLDRLAQLALRRDRPAPHLRPGQPRRRHGPELEHGQDRPHRAHGRRLRHRARRHPRPRRARRQRHQRRRSPSTRSAPVRAAHRLAVATSSTSRAPTAWSTPRRWPSSNACARSRAPRFTPVTLPLDELGVDLYALSIILSAEAGAAFQDLTLERPRRPAGPPGARRLAQRLPRGAVHPGGRIRAGQPPAHGADGADGAGVRARWMCT